MKKLNREEIYKFNRSLTKKFQEIQSEIENIDTSSHVSLDYDPDVYERMKDIQDAFIALKKELLNMSEKKEEK